MPPDISTTPRPLIPTGRPPWPGHALGEHEHLVLVHLDEHRGVRAGQVDASPCASWISRPTCTPSSPEVSGKRLSRRRARTAKVPEASLVSVIAAAEIASGVLATRSGTQTRTMPGTSCIRSAISAAACAQPAGPRRLPSATRSRMTPSRWRSSAGTPTSRTAARILACRMRSNCCLFRPLSTISPSLSSTHGSSGPCARGASAVGGTPLVCQPARRKSVSRTDSGGKHETGNGC